MTCSYSKEFSASSFTNVENVFIYEYLPISSGDAVKVYLYGLYLCQNQNIDKSLSDIAKTLNLDEETVVDCFTYWEEFGLLNIVSREPFTVHYLPLKTTVGAKPRKFKAEKYTDFCNGVQSLIPSRMISTSEYTEYFNIMESYGIKPDAMLMIIKYCADRKGNDIGYKYISKVAKDFGNRGIVTVDLVEKELSSYILHTSEITRILKALSLKRQPEVEDLTLLKKWTTELDFEVDTIVFAGSKIKKGSMQKLDEFLLELYSLKSFTKEEISNYLDKKQQVFDLTIKINKALCIYMDVIDMVIDTYTNKWVSYGFDDNTLIYIAHVCFTQGKKSLQDMDELVEMLYSRGFIDLSSVTDYFESIKKDDEFIKRLLAVAGINRRPNSWDRQNLVTWKSWNFSEEMILEAGKLSAGKSSPIAYVNGVLSNWKNKGIFNPSDVSVTPSIMSDSQETYNREYERRRQIASTTATQNLEKAYSLDGFSETYSRLHSIEKDLAFAEINGNNEALTNFEKEKAELLVKVGNILRNAHLTLQDLSPQYACKKCNDTGYVGTHRCDCYEKFLDLK